jgi:hypothetical protein
MKRRLIDLVLLGIAAYLVIELARWLGTAMGR